MFDSFESQKSKFQSRSENAAEEAAFVALNFLPSTSLELRSAFKRICVLGVSFNDCFSVVLQERDQYLIGP